MKFYKKIITATALIVIPLIAYADVKIDQALANIYSRFDNENNCWLFEDNMAAQLYCMKVDQYNKVVLRIGKERIYVLLSGDHAGSATKDGESASGHSDGGRIAALIFENKNNKLKLIAGNLNIEVGNWGKAPTDWKLIKLAPDYWGWKNTTRVTSQGITLISGLIFAPYGKTIKYVADILVEVNNEAHYDNEIEGVKHGTILKSSLDIDTTTVINGLYQLIAKTSGQKEGKKITPKIWKISFDKKTWSYIQPKDWPLE